MGIMPASVPDFDNRRMIFLSRGSNVFHSHNLSSRAYHKPPLAALTRPPKNHPLLIGYRAE